MFLLAKSNAAFLTKPEMADFDVLIPKTGEYKTAISARHARGWLNVNKVAEPEEM